MSSLLLYPQFSVSGAGVVRSELGDGQFPNTTVAQTALDQEQKEEMKQLLSAVARGQLRLAL